MTSDKRQHELRKKLMEQLNQDITALQETCQKIKQTFVLISKNLSVNTSQVKIYPEPVPDSYKAVYEILEALEPNKALVGPKILSKLSFDKAIGIDQSVLTRRIMPFLKKNCGVCNKPKIGYYIDRSKQQFQL